MKKEVITKLTKNFEESAFEYQGVECWSARELQVLLGYSQWRNFENAIDKAKKKSRILSINPALFPFHFTTDG